MVWSPSTLLWPRKTKWWIFDATYLYTFSGMIFCWINARYFFSRKSQSVNFKFQWFLKFQLKERFLESFVILFVISCPTDNRETLAEIMYLQVKAISSRSKYQHGGGMDMTVIIQIIFPIVFPNSRGTLIFYKNH